MPASVPKIQSDVVASWAKSSVLESSSIIQIQQQAVEMPMIEIIGGQSVDDECYEIIQTYTASLIHVNKSPRADVRRSSIRRAIFDHAVQKLSAKSSPGGRHSSPDAQQLISQNSQAVSALVPQCALPSQVCNADSVVGRYLLHYLYHDERLQ